mmetsp:Transcript_435/g.787  ORF Transcript_435/g.787 Transcript_435/m.787 type:complete len:230 (+) Transcript_435:54-743(+)
MMSSRSRRRAAPKVRDMRCRRWREELIRACAERVRKGRAERIRRGRLMEMGNVAKRGLETEEWNVEDTSALRNVVEEELVEWGHLTAVLDNNEEVEMLVEELRSCIQAEKAYEEDEILQWMEEEEARDLQALLDHGTGNVEDGLLCPICRLSRMAINRGTLFCRCGVRLHLDQTSGITIDVVRRRLEEVYGHHTASVCRGSLAFEVRDDFGFITLSSFCRVCGSRDIVV